LIETFAFTSLAAASIGCSGNLTNGKTQTGSQAMARAPQGFVIAETAQERVTFLSRTSLAPRSIEVDGQPARVALAQGRAFVSVVTHRKLLVLSAEGDTELARVGEVDVGAEPFGVVASPDETRVYVALMQTGEILEVDPLSLAIVRRIPSRLSQPRWLAIHPSGKTLYATSALDRSIAVVDLASGGVQLRGTPTLVSSSFDFNGVPAEPPALRFTGDPSVTPDGERLIVPSFAVDHNTPVHEADDPAPDGEDPGFPRGEPGGYASQGGSRFVPSLEVVPLTPDGQPTQPTPFADVVIALSAFTSTPKLGYPSAAVPTADGKSVVVTMEGATGGVLVALDADESSGFAEAAPAPGFPGGISGTAFRRQIGFDASAGPRAVVIEDDATAFVYSFVARGVGRLPLDGLAASIEDRSDLLFGPSPDLESPAATLDEVILGGDRRDTDVVVGEQLFYAADDSRMSQPGVGLSCATCHFDGRNDGLTWTFTRGPRQTPSLAGKVSLQEPVRWDGARATVADDAMRTSQGLMGGAGMTQLDAERIAKFVDTTPEVDVARRASDDPAVERGRAIFNSAEVGCITCHNGPRHTDRKKYALYGLEAQTRALVGISASAPYLHDGRAKTLRDVLLLARDGSMGDTSSLTDAQLDDLVAYLESL
jgi:mono/diheme cytochrome c family protein